MRNFWFFHSGHKLNHDDRELEYADCISITFKWQKKDEQMDTVTQMVSGVTLLCPFCQWTAVIKRIRGYSGATDETLVSAVWRNRRMEHITSKIMVSMLEAGVAAMGHDQLGIKKGEIGTHSIRSGAVMAMYLGECPVYTIMMIGWWSSDMILRCI